MVSDEVPNAFSEQQENENTKKKVLYDLKPDFQRISRKLRRDMNLKEKMEKITHENPYVFVCHSYVAV